MATGQSAFGGNASAVIFDADPEPHPDGAVGAEPGGSPEARRNHRQGDREDRELRYQTAAELRADLKRLKRDMDSSRTAAASTSSWPAASAAPGSGSVPATTAAIPLRRPFPWMKVAVAAIIIVAFVALVLRLRTTRQAPASSFAEMTITPVTSTGNIHSAAISSDGSWLAYVQDDKAGHGVWVRQLGTGSTAQVVPGSPGEIAGITFSRDGNYLDSSSVMRPGIGDALPSPFSRRRTAAIDCGRGQPHRFLPGRQEVRFVRQASKNKTSNLIIANADGSSETPLAVLNNPAFFQPQVRHGHPMVHASPFPRL